MLLVTYKTYIQKVTDEIQIKDKQLNDLFIDIQNGYLNLLNNPKYPRFQDLENVRSENTTKIVACENSTDPETIKQLYLFNNESVKKLYSYEEEKRRLRQSGGFSQQDF